MHASCFPDTNRFGKRRREDCEASSDEIQRFVLSQLATFAHYSWLQRNKYQSTHLIRTGDKIYQPIIYLLLGTLEIKYTSKIPTVKVITAHNGTATIDGNRNVS